MRIVRLEKGSAYWSAAGRLIEGSYQPSQVNPLSLPVDGNAWADQAAKAHPRLRAVHAVVDEELLAVADASVTLLAPHIAVRRLGVIDNLAWEATWDQTVVTAAIEASFTWLKTVADVAWLDAPQLALAPAGAIEAMGLQVQYNRFVKSLAARSSAAS